MKFSVKIETVRELLDAAGVPVVALAKRLGLGESITSLKVRHVRPFYADEIGAVVGAVNDAGRMDVTEDKVVRLVGKKNIMLRGYLG
jgi:hypothetical protein